MVVLSRAFLHEHFLFFTNLSYQTPRTLSTSRTSPSSLGRQVAPSRITLAENPRTTTPTCCNRIISHFPHTEHSLSRRRCMFGHLSSDKLCCTTSSEHHLDSTTFSKTTLYTEHLFQTFFSRQAALKNRSRKLITRVAETRGQTLPQFQPSLTGKEASGFHDTSSRIHDHGGCSTIVKARGMD